MAEEPLRRPKRKVRRLRRETADRAFAGFLARLAEVNAGDAPYAFRVTTVVLFGSYATDAALVGDVDLAVGLEPKFPTGSPEQDDLERQRQLARIAAVANPFHNLVEEIGWPILEVYRALQHWQSTLSVHPLSDLEGLRPTPPYRVVFGTWSPKPDRQPA